MEDYKYYPIGTIIEYNGNKYEVVASNACTNCAFLNKNKKVCNAVGKLPRWSCSRFARRDFCDVIFRRVENTYNN